MNHVNVEEYGEWKRNDFCTIKGEQGVFKFMWVANQLGPDGPAPQPKWVTVFGPIGHHRQFRHFTIERLKAVPKSKAKLLGNKNQ